MKKGIVNIELNVKNGEMTQEMLNDIMITICEAVSCKYDNIQAFYSAEVNNITEIDDDYVVDYWDDDEYYLD